jgi:hypothetical protein
MLVNKIDARTSLWVGLNANQSFASPVGGMIWPEANEVVREHIRRVPLDVLPPTHCGPPVVSFQLAKWGDFYPKTKIATRGSVAWFWETTEACRVAAEDVGERIMVYFDEWKNIWPTSESVISWILSNNAFGQHTRVLLPAYFFINRQIEEFESYSAAYLDSKDLSAKGQASEFVRKQYLDYIESLRKAW